MPAELEVVRVPGPEPGAGAGWRARAERWAGLEPRWSRWWRAGTLARGRTISGVDILYTWMSPFESAEPIARLARELGKPWVADLGDPWALDEMFVYPSRAHRWLELRRMRRALGGAAAVVMSTREAACRLQAWFPELRGKLVVSIPNGFDAHDFEGDPPVRKDDAFRIVHTGYLHTELGLRQRRSSGLHRLLGGAVRGVDFLTRSHVFLLEAIEGLIEQEPSLRSRIEVHLAGVLSDADTRYSGLPGLVRMPGYLPHDETVELMRSADLLFLPMHDLPSEARAGIVPGKTYEYLASKRPILAAVPDGDARDLLEAAGTARLCRPADVEGLKTAIREVIARRRAGAPVLPPSPDLLLRYEYTRLTGELADVFDAALARNGTRAFT
jgi:glycosyltransferase involved in cell wall biosynthesis